MFRKVLQKGARSGVELVARGILPVIELEVSVGYGEVFLLANAIDGCEGAGVGRADNTAYVAHLRGRESCFGKCLRCGGDDVALRVRERAVEIEDDDRPTVKIVLLNHGTP